MQSTVLTYEKFPMLLFLSYETGDALAEIAFEVEDQSANDYLETSSLLGEIIQLIELNKTKVIKLDHRNYLINDSLFEKVSLDEQFRQRESANFFITDIQPGTGTICVDPSWQYLYMLLDKGGSKKFKNVDGRYLSVALFKENFFIGTEEAVITEHEFTVLPTGYYGQHPGPGSFVSPLVTLLSYIHKGNGGIKVANDINKTSEQVFYIDY